MITQKIIARTDSLKLDKIISRYGEDSMRQVVFIIVRPDPESDELIPITIPEDAVGSFRILKPSGNFVIVPMSKSVLATGETAFDVVLPASVTTAKGSGYYDIRITSDTDKYYFTAQGDFLIDDNIISDEAIEDVSEVNGLIFPDDFLTVEDHVAYIDDETISTDSTWSSDKISEEIEAHAGGDVSKTVSGNPVTFTDGADAPLVNCLITISPKQLGSGVPSPDNIRPISGYSSVVDNVAGKNLFDKTTYTFTSEKYVSLSTGNIGSNSSYACTESYIPCSNLAGQTITLNHIPGGNQPGMAFYDSSNGYISGGKGDAITVPSNAVYYRFTVPIEYASGDDVQIELGSTSTTYEPYAGHTYTIALGGTRYGGTLDVKRGKFDDIKGVYTATGNENITKASTNDGFYFSTNGLKANGPTVIKCSHFPVVDAQTYLTTKYTTYIGEGNDRLFLNLDIDLYPTAQDVANYFLAQANAGTPVQWYVEKKTPQEIDLTPTQVRSLLGTNTMWTDGDNLEVEYITERFQPLIDSIKQL